MWHYYVYGSPTFRCAPEHSWQSENVHARPAHCTSTMVCIGGGLLTARHARALVKIGPRCAAACLATLAICMSGLSVCSGGNYYLGIHFIAFTHLWPTARAYGMCDYKHDSCELNFHSTFDVKCIEDVCGCVSDKYIIAVAHTVGCVRNIYSNNCITKQNRPELLFSAWQNIRSTFSPLAW